MQAPRHLRTSRHGTIAQEVQAELLQAEEDDEPNLGSDTARPGDDQVRRCARARR